MPSKSSNLTLGPAGFAAEHTPSPSNPEDTSTPLSTSTSTSTSTSKSSSGPASFAAEHTPSPSAPKDISKALSLSRNSDAVPAFLSALCLEVRQRGMARLRSHGHLRGLEEELTFIRTRKLEDWIKSSGWEPSSKTTNVGLESSTNTFILPPSTPYVAGTTLRQFHYFPRLPAELRSMIWNLTRPAGRAVRVYETEDGKGIRTRAPIPTPLLHVNQESRDLALKWYSTSFNVDYPLLPDESPTMPEVQLYFDTSRDWLYLSCLESMDETCDPSLHLGHFGTFTLLGISTTSKKSFCKRVIYEYGGCLYVPSLVKCGYSCMEQMVIVSSGEGMPADRWSVDSGDFEVEEGPTHEWWVKREVGEPRVVRGRYLGVEEDVE